MITTKYGKQLYEAIIQGRSSLSTNDLIILNKEISSQLFNKLRGDINGSKTIN